MGATTYCVPMVAVSMSTKEELSADVYLPTILPQERSYMCLPLHTRNEYDGSAQKSNLQQCETHSRENT